MSVQPLLDPKECDELLRLAHLLRLSAYAARKIAATRPLDESDIDVLAAQAEQIAHELTEIAKRPSVLN